MIIMCFVLHYLFYNVAHIINGKLLLNEIKIDF